MLICIAVCIVYCTVVWCIILCCIVSYCSVAYCIVVSCIVVLVSRGPNAVGPPAERSVEYCSLECRDNVLERSRVPRSVGTTCLVDLVFPGV